MRLLNIHSLQVEGFPGQPPAYVILSHTWGSDEVTLQDVNAGKLHGRAGGRKIAAFCKNVIGVDYVWVDTCCIDKTSSAELSEAINSMYCWYRDAVECHAYLSDVVSDSEFEQSRWFTRGWTLQELLAPQIVKFYDADWNYMGTRDSFQERIHNITGILRKVLVTGDVSYSSVAQRMSWVAKRQTTRLEDMAYCMLGLFDINMPLLYGEGDKSFIRLQEEIIRVSSDQSIYAWDASPLDELNGLLAPSPALFADSAVVGAFPEPLGGAATITSQGITLDLPVLQSRKWDYVAILSCPYQDDIGSRIGIPLERVQTATGTVRDHYRRLREKPERITIFNMGFKTTRITVPTQRKRLVPRGCSVRCMVRYFEVEEPLSWRFVEGYPDGMWANSTLSDTLSVEVPPGDGKAHGVAVFELKRAKSTYVGLEVALHPTQAMSVRLLDLTAGIGAGKAVETVDGQLTWEEGVRRGTETRSTAKLDVDEGVIEASWEKFHTHGAPILRVAMRLKR